MLALGEDPTEDSLAMYFPSARTTRLRFYGQGIGLCVTASLMIPAFLVLTLKLQHLLDDTVSWCICAAPMGLALISLFVTSVLLYTQHLRVVRDKYFQLYSLVAEAGAGGAVAGVVPMPSALSQTPLPGISGAGYIDERSPLVAPVVGTTNSNGGDEPPPAAAASGASRPGRNCCSGPSYAATSTSASCSECMCECCLISCDDPEFRRVYASACQVLDAIQRPASASAAASAGSSIISSRCSAPVAASTPRSSPSPSPALTTCTAETGVHASPGTGTAATPEAAITTKAEAAETGGLRAARCTRGGGCCCVGLPFASRLMGIVLSVPLGALASLVLLVLRFDDYIIIPVWGMGSARVNSSHKR